MLIQVLYFYREECESVRSLKNELSADDSIEAKFSKKIPGDFLDHVKPNATILILDDFETYFSEKANAELLYKISSIYCHHFFLHCFFLVQSISSLKKDSYCNKAVNQSSIFVFFKTSYDARSLKHYMGNFQLKLKGGLSVYECFEKYIQNSSRFSFLLLCVSPRFRKHSALTNFLMSSPGPLRTFHESDDSDDE